MAEQITLNIFDFDGTIFKSPVPNRKLWDSTLLGKIMSMKTQGGLGWFQDPLTLAVPYVPQNPDDMWFVQHVKDAVLESMVNPNSKTVLLTGRSTLYADRIKEIVASAKLEFDDFGFQSSNKETTTMEFKMDFIRKMISKYHPNSINMYDDRIKHYARFKTFLKDEYAMLTSSVTHIDPSGETLLLKDLEIELVSKMNESSNNKLCWKETVQYTAVVLDKESVKILKQNIPPILDWTPYYHHMTIHATKLPEEEQNKLGIPSRSNIGLGKEVILTVTSIGQSDKAYAVQVEGFVSSNKIHHITCCVSSIGKAVDSNFIKEWNPIENEFTVKGIISEVSKMAYINKQPKQSGAKSTSKMTPLGKLYKDNAKSQTVNVKDAITQIKDWMLQNNLSDDKENESQVIEYIKFNFCI